MALSATAISIAASAEQIFGGEVACLRAIIMLLNAQSANPMTAEQISQGASQYQIFGSANHALQAVVYLLANGASAGGGGGTYSDNYGGAAPTITPSNAGAIATDSSTGNIWVYLNNVWTFTGVTA